MSISAWKAVWATRGLTAPERLVMLALADFAGDDGVCWPSMPVLSHRCEMGDRGVRKIIRRLQNAGHISVVESRGRGRSNEYTLNLKPEPECEKPERETGFNDEIKPEPACIKPERQDTKPEPACTKTGTTVPPNLKEPPLLTLTTFVLPRDEPDPVPKQKRKCAIHPDAVPGDRDYAAAEKRGLSNQEADHEFEKFRDHHTAKGSKFLDWNAAFRTWLDSPYRQRPKNTPTKRGIEAATEFARQYF